MKPQMVARTRSAGTVTPLKAESTTKTPVPTGMAIKVETQKGDVSGVLHPVEGAKSAVVLLGGSRGGLDGPSRIWPRLADKLNAGGVTALRLSYRVPNDVNESTHDVLAAIDALKRSGVEQVTLIGWSFGGAVAINAGAQSSLVTRVATVAAQSYGTDAVDQLAAKELLLLHGAADEVIPLDAAKDIYARDPGPKKELVIFPKDGHALTGHRNEMFDKLFDFSRES